MLKVKIETKKPKYCIAKDGEVYVIKHIAKNNGKIRAVVDVKVKSRESYIYIDEHPCPLAVKILDSGCIITSAEVYNDRVIWNLICGGESFIKLMNTVSCKIIDKRYFREKDKITHREYVVLKKALEKGFFDNPRKVNLGELAKETGLAKSTLSDCLRRGIKKVLKSYFENL